MRPGNGDRIDGGGCQSCSDETDRQPTQGIEPPDLVQTVNTFDADAQQSYEAPLLRALVEGQSAKKRDVDHLEACLAAKRTVDALGAVARLCSDNMNKLEPKTNKDLADTLAGMRNKTLVGAIVAQVADANATEQPGENSGQWNSYEMISPSMTVHLARLIIRTS